jgi:hypothetical protein
MQILSKYILKLHIIISIIIIFSCGAVAQFKVEDILKRISEEYKYTQKNNSVASLVRLDSMLRAFVDSARKNIAFPKAAKHWKDEYSKLELSIGHYSEEFEYSGQFLYDAHVLNPNSPYRSLTLYASIVGVDHSSGLGRFPYLESAFKYVKEFPQGHFIFEVYNILAGFYTDLFMALRDGKEGASYHYDCLEEYIDKTPIPEQMVRAQKQSIYYYEQALIIRPNDSGTKETLQEVKDGTVSGWSTCSD